MPRSSVVVDIWRLDLSSAELARRCRSLLAPDERARADRFHFAEHARRFTIARAGLRSILARYAGTEPAAIRLRLTALGKPELADGAGPFFNLSHADDLALYAVSAGVPVGIDVEAAARVVSAEDIAGRWFTPAERDLVRAASDARRSAAFLHVWTRKEALLKGLGCGLSGLEERTDVLGAAAGEWGLRSIRAGPGFIAALAVRAVDRPLRLRYRTGTVQPP